MFGSKIHSTFDAKNVAPLVLGQHYALDGISDVEALSKIGIYGIADIMEVGYGMDTIQQGVTVPSIGTPVQFLQNWLPGFVAVITGALKADEIVGISTVGTWEDEQIVQGIIEGTGSATPYNDMANTPQTSWNTNFVTRSVVRFELGLRVSALEEKRAAAMRVNAADQKRLIAAKNLEITRNQIAFYGYNNGNNQTYGFLNDPNLPPYQTVATGAVSGSKLWAMKTFQEIVNDIRTAAQYLRTVSKDTVSVDMLETTLALPTSCYEYLTVTTNFGVSVIGWIKETYPKMRIVSAPQLDGANGGANVFYLFADKVTDGVSSDDQRTFIQVVPAKFQVLGVQQLTKGYEEDYSNATAGVMCKRPYAVYRGSGI